MDRDCGKSVFRRLGAVGHAVVAQNRGDAQAVIAEDFAAALALGRAMFEMGAPALDGVFVAPEGERQDFALVRKAGKSLDRDEAVDLFELGTQGCSDVEIVSLAVRLRPDFENHGDHARIPSFSFQPKRSSKARPITHSRSLRERKPSSSVNMVTA